MSNFFYELLHLYDSEQYQSFNFTPNTLRIIFLFAWIGIIIALIGSFYSNYYLGSFVKKLILRGADSEETALSLYELGIENQPMLTRSLREGSVLRKTVKAVSPDKARSDISDVSSMAAKYYIEADMHTYAQKRFKVEGNGIISLIISIIAITIVLLILLIFGPWILGIADGLLAAMTL